jgi:hypothetical protein
MSSAPLPSTSQLFIFLASLSPTRTAIYVKMTKNECDDPR